MSESLWSARDNPAFALCSKAGFICLVQTPQAVQRLTDVLIFEHLLVYSGSGSHTDVAVFTGLMVLVVLSIMFTENFPWTDSDNRRSDRCL